MIRKNGFNSLDRARRVLALKKANLGEAPGKDFVAGCQQYP